MTSSLLTEYQKGRAHTLQRAAPLSPEDCTPQSMPDASPVKWHLAHTTWFFETFVLGHPDACQVQAFEPHHPAYRSLFNSYYDGVGARHPRAQRGLVTRPDMAQVLDYRSAVDVRMITLLAHTSDLTPALTHLITLGLHHEQQHQELMLTDVLHLFSLNPLHPAYSDRPAAPYPPSAPLQWLDSPQGVVSIGHADADIKHALAAGDARFAFDNELPRHPTYISSCQIASRLSTQGEFADFVADGGYQRPELWLAEGWDWRRNHAIEHPLYWQPSRTSNSGNDWYTFGLHGLQPLDAHAPVCQLSYFEADAFARWSQARLPTEAEWEATVQAAPDVQAALLPTHPQQWHGHVWQWTQSSYAAYPGFQIAAGAVGEYNGKFMVNQYVLRGSSSATPAGHARHSYRNFFPATARWQFAGVRLARDSG